MFLYLEIMIYNYLIQLWLEHNTYHERLLCSNVELLPKLDLGNRNPFFFSAVYWKKM